MNEFSDRALVVGKITGLRSFRVDELGRLTGVTHQDVWRPGVNVATCATDGGAMRTESQEQRAYRRSMNGLGRGSVPQISDFADRPVCLVKHRTACVQCTCGFWAYFDGGDNPHHTAGNVEAVVNGYGTVTVGSRGFRAEKAEIVALVDDPPAPLLKRITALGWVQLTLGMANAGVVVGFSILALVTWWNLINVAAVAFSAFTWTRKARVRWLRPKAKHAIPSSVRRAYPGIPVIAGRQAALAAFPLTPPPEPTPDDADFWTRVA